MTRHVDPVQIADQRALVSLVEEIDRLRAETERLRGQVRQLEGLADTDPLAPVLNRRAFVRELSRLLSLGARYGLQPGLIYVDLDAFKALNDRHGHAVGDAALTHVARMLKDHVRTTDIVGRLGGDEFAVGLADGGEEGARLKAGRLSARLNRTPFEANGVSLTVRASFGATALSVRESAEEALDRADQAMYRAKRARRAALTGASAAR